MNDSKDPPESGQGSDSWLRDLAHAPSISPLSRGAHLGPYEIVGRLGAGGMGEVYRARDPRLARDVAVKIVRSDLAATAEGFRRFEQEARAVGALNHPNILAVFDVGDHEGTPYLVTELLEGETLREKLGAPLPLPKALDYAVQIARGLTAAHEMRIVHRDLKPENLFVTRDGRIKILDFGLAKLEAAPASGEETVAAATSAGTILGTAGYMSPEQVRGEAVDHRSDLFSFGAILYEMLCGRRAFPAPSAVEAMHGILTEEPSPFGTTNGAPPARVERILRHCLEKSPSERFQSARDLVFALEALREELGHGATPTPSRQRRHTLLWSSIVLAALGIAVFAGLYLSARQTPVAPPDYKRLTFRRGAVTAARFAPDGQSIVYSAKWEGARSEVFSTRAEGGESRAMGLRDSDLLAISPAAQMALLLRRRPRVDHFGGTLARAPLSGGAPREVMEDVQEADFIPGGQLAVVRWADRRNRLEFPIGNVVHESSIGISKIRVSPKGDLVAFLARPIVDDDSGSVMVVDRTGKKTKLWSTVGSLQGLAWSATGEEIWFTAADAAVVRALHAVTLSGRHRVVARVPGTLTLHDISRDGRVLVSLESWRNGAMYRGKEDSHDRELSWLDGTDPTDLSADGKTILFTESLEGGGASYGVYLRKVDGSAAIKLGDGRAEALSPDGKWALARPVKSPSPLVALPTGAGEPKVLTGPTMDHKTSAWHPDGKRVLFGGREGDAPYRVFVQALSGGAPRAISPPGVTAWALSLDGKRVALVADDKAWLYPVDEGQSQPLAGIERLEEPIRFGADGRTLYVARYRHSSVVVHRVELDTGKRHLFKEIRPADAAGISLGAFLITPDATAYAYGFNRMLSDLHLVSGWK